MWIYMVNVHVNSITVSYMVCVWNENSLASKTLCNCTWHGRCTYMYTFIHWNVCAESDMVEGLSGVHVHVVKCTWYDQDTSMIRTSTIRTPLITIRTPLIIKYMYTVIVKPSTRTQLYMYQIHTPTYNYMYVHVQDLHVYMYMYSNRRKTSRNPYSVAYHGVSCRHVVRVREGHTCTYLQDYRQWGIGGKVYVT